jgi:hypothetical protein
MEKIEITAKFTRDGSLIPIELLLENQSILILDVGRQWETEDGKHLLVMDFQNQTYHLFFQLQDLSWYLVRDLKQKSEPS